MSLSAHAASLIDSLTLDDLHRAALIANVLWFTAAFVCFSCCPAWSVALLLPKRKEEQREQRQRIAGAIRFLGNLNLACAALCAMLLWKYEAFPTAEQKGLLCAALGLMHLSQFLGNLPMALRELCTSRPGLWPVLRGTMRSIFLTDAFMAALDGAVAACYFYPTTAPVAWHVVRTGLLQPIGLYQTPARV